MSNKNTAYYCHNSSSSCAFLCISAFHCSLVIIHI